MSMKTVHLCDKSSYKQYSEAFELLSDETFQNDIFKNNDQTTFYVKQKQNGFSGFLKDLIYANYASDSDLCSLVQKIVEKSKEKNFFPSDSLKDLCFNYITKSLDNYKKMHVGVENSMEKALELLRNVNNGKNSISSSDPIISSSIPNNIVDHLCDQSKIEDILRFLDLTNQNIYTNDDGSFYRVSSSWTTRNKHNISVQVLDSFVTKIENGINDLSNNTMPSDKSNDISNIKSLLSNAIKGLKTLKSHYKNEESQFNQCITRLTNLEKNKFDNDVPVSIITTDSSKNHSSPELNPLSTSSTSISEQNQKKTTPDLSSDIFTLSTQSTQPTGSDDSVIFYTEKSDKSLQTEPENIPTNKKEESVNDNQEYKKSLSNSPTISSLPPIEIDSDVGKIIKSFIVLKREEIGPETFIPFCSDVLNLKTENNIITSTDIENLPNYSKIINTIKLEEKRLALKRSLDEYIKAKQEEENQNLSSST